MLQINSKAELLHQSALSNVMVGNYVEAQEDFARALNVFEDLPIMLDTRVQFARIARDCGFTFLRAALDQSDTVLLDKSQAILEKSLSSTAPVISGTFLNSEADDVVPIPSKNLRHELWAEHGATLGLLGRFATAKAVALGIDTSTKREIAIKYKTIDQVSYGLAHDMLRIGNNGYYRVSNAMTAARQEVINRRIPNALFWLGRAAVGLVWITAHDRRNINPSVRTILHRLPHLRSRTSAIRSVITSP